MFNLEIYCTALQYFSVIDKLPSYIKPLGLGNNTYPKHWLAEKNGENIANLNRYFSEWTGLYWLLQNTNVQYLSYARLGKFMLSNNVNKFINLIKIPLTFRMYPTLHDYLILKKTKTHPNCNTKNK